MSCSSSEELETIKLVSNEKEIELKVEIADEPHEHNEGLMGREKLKEDHGMLFVFEKSQRVSFWMKNTYIDLDIVFMDENKKVVGSIENMKAHDLTSRSINKPYNYAIEMNAGSIKNLNIKVNDIVNIK